VTALLELDDVRVHYGPVEALKAISLRVDVGETVALIGGNGAGKTTTLKTVSGLRRVTSGKIRFEGGDITGTAAHALVARGLCQVPEGRGIFPGMSVRENLEMGTYARGPTRADDFARVFGLFPRLADRQRQSGGTLSGGEQQMLAIGRALMARPTMLLLDEPSLGLAPQIVLQIFSILGEISAQGTTVLLVEQNAVQALKLADRAYVLESGNVVREGTGAELLADDSLRAAYLGGDVASA
jgi:branched-chain amino acid transport system ATP-binding protein